MTRLFIGIVALVGLASGLAANMEKAQEAYRKGNESFRQGEYQVAISHYREVLRQEPSYESRMDKPLGLAYLKLGDEGKALFHLERALKAKPDDPELPQAVAELEARDVLPDSSGARRTLSGDKLRRHHIFINSGDMARGALSLGYERAMTTHSTWLVDLVYGNRSSSSSSYTTYGGGLGVHFWPDRLNGFFAGPKINFQIAEYDDPVGTYNYSTFTKNTARQQGTLTRYALGAEAGYQWQQANGFTWAVGYGYFYNQFIGGDPNAGSYYTYNYYSGTGTATMGNLLATLGWAF